MERIINSMRHLRSKFNEMPVCLLTATCKQKTGALRYCNYQINYTIYCTCCNYTKWLNLAAGPFPSAILKTWNIYTLFIHWAFKFSCITSKLWSSTCFMQHTLMDHSAAPCVLPAGQFKQQMLPWRYCRSNGQKTPRRVLPSTPDRGNAPVGLRWKINMQKTWTDEVKKNVYFSDSHKIWIFQGSKSKVHLYSIYLDPTNKIQWLKWLKQVNQVHSSSSRAAEGSVGQSPWKKVQ